MFFIKKFIPGIYGLTILSRIIAILAQKLLFYSFFLFSSFLFSSSSFSQTPAPTQTKNILLMNGIAHIGNGEVIENSVIGFEKGKLILVANAKTVKIDRTKYDTIIYVEGKHIYPGFISVNSTLGLTEIDAVRATRDFNDVGDINPHIRSEIAFNAESKIIPTVRSNGILLAQATPRGGLISGTSSIMELDGWNWEDAVYKKDDGIHLNWPAMFQGGGWWAESGPMKKNEKTKEQLSLLKSFFEDAKAYSQVSNNEEKNLRFEAMRGIFDGSKTLFIHTDFVKEIIQAVNFAKENDIKKMIIVGGYDSWRVTDMLKENNIAVILKRVHELPAREDEDVDLPFKIPALLQKAGVLFCLDNSGDMEAMNSRNLPFYAGTAAAYGLTKEQALMSISSSSAKILGIDKSVGTLETGKDATLVISSGDALDMRTNNIEYAFIRGKSIDLENHQKALYRKYKGKYEK